MSRLLRVNTSAMLIMSTVPTGIFFLRGELGPNWRVAIGLAIAALASTWFTRRHTIRRVGVLAVVAGLAIVNLHITPFAADETRVAEVLSTVLAAVAAAATLLGFSALARATDLRTACFGGIAIALTIAVFTRMLERMPGQRMSGGDISQVKGPVPHAVVGKAYLPNSVSRTYYRENPRGYFQEADAVNGPWQLVMHGEGNVASLAYPTGAPERVRIEIVRAPGEEAWTIQLASDDFPVRAATDYQLTFRARADAPRTIAVGIAQAHPPWSGLGFYRTVSVDTSWHVFAEVFQLSNADDLAGFQFNLGGSSVPVELADIALRRVGEATRIVPPAATRYAIEYRFDAYGCREFHRAQRQRPGTWRLLALGDSYTLGMGVREGDTFGARLERLLNDSLRLRDPARRYEVITCGVPGHGTREERLFYERSGYRYRPDVVLLTMHWNDGQLARDEASTGSWLPRGANEGLGPRLVWRLRAADSAGRAADTTTRLDRVGIEVRLLRAAVRARGAELVVMLFRHNNDARWAALRDTVRNALRGESVPVLDIGELLLSKYDSDALAVLPGTDGHPNEVAHREAAQALLIFLTQSGMIRDARPGPRGSANRTR